VYLTTNTPYNVFYFSVIKPNGVTFVDAAGCIGDAVRAYTALHYLGRLISGDTGEHMVVM
jgi:hypothetical protein